MRLLFYISVAVMIVFSYGMEQLKPDAKGKKPVLYWATGYDESRQEQIDVFHQWLAKNAPEEDQFTLKPAVGTNNNKQKIIMQCVSGIGPDIIDISSESGYLQFYQKMGIIDPLDGDDGAGGDLAAGYESSKTYDEIARAIEVDGRQYMFPCNVSTNLYYVNVTAMKDLGVPVPSANWSYQDFEKTARAYREAAIKKHGEEGRYFFLMKTMNTLTMLRNLGIDRLNETLTASAFTRKNKDGLGFSDMLSLKHKWTYVDNILPQANDLQSVEVTAGGHGVHNELFRKNRLAMHLTGRWSLTGYRLFNKDPKFSDIELAVLPPPQNGFQNTDGGSRSAAMYTGSGNKTERANRKRLARYFFRFLASSEYNNIIVESADALPPLPEFAQTKAFLEPENFKNEWPIHKAYSTAFYDLAICSTHSPFIETNVLNREMNGKISAVMMETQRLSAEVACAKLHERINLRIQLNLKEDESLRPAFEAACADQEKIDALRESGKKIPRELITNRYYLKYYEAMGMLE